MKNAKVYQTDKKTHLQFRLKKKHLFSTIVSYSSRRLAAQNQFLENISIVLIQNKKNINLNICYTIQKG